jgi:tight adherence protein B
MQLWILLFATFCAIFGAAIIVWWRVEAEKRRHRVVRSIASGVDPVKSTVTTTVLMEMPAPRGWRPRLRGRSLHARDAGGAAGSVFFAGKSALLALTLGMALAGYLLGTKLAWIFGPTAGYLAAISLGAIPRIYLTKRLNKRVVAMEEQFPDALDFLARSVRAGNAFSIGLELLAEEVSEPLKSEILKVTREMALGAGLEDALHGMIARIPLFELRFFVAAVMLQRETGGNLAEVLSKLAIAVRERLRLRGQIKAASGQARLTAMVLICLPIVTMIMLEVISPSYMRAMTDDPLGRNLLAAAVVSQVLGYLVMQQIVRIEV